MIHFLRSTEKTVVQKLNCTLFWYSVSKTNRKMLENFTQKNFQKFSASFSVALICSTVSKKLSEKYLKNFIEQKF